jgi:hypothetical protein
MPEGTVKPSAPCPMIEALGASRLNIIFLVESIYPGYPQFDFDENGLAKQVKLRQASLLEC